MLEGWSKVRDSSGELTWIETRNLANTRTVMVKAPLAPVRERAEDGAPVVFQARQSVILELLDAAGEWVHVRHPDGHAGYVKAAEIWGG